MDLDTDRNVIWVFINIWGQDLVNDPRFGESVSIFSIIVKSLNRGHLEVLKNSSVIKKWPLLGI